MQVTIFPSRHAVVQSIGLLRRMSLVQCEDHRANLMLWLGSNQDRVRIVSWLNAHTLTQAMTDPALRASLLQASIVLRDGIGISILLRLMGVNAGENMNGTDLIPEIIRINPGKSVALLGTTEPFLSAAAEAIEQLGGKVVLRLDGFQENSAYADKLAETNADIVILAMGVPKQEKIAIFLAERLETHPLILTGGAILDFMAGRFPRSPRIWRYLRLEWLFRLINEPRRLWRRYLLGGAVFAAYAASIVLEARSPLLGDETARARGAEPIPAGASPGSAGGR
jgi:exopolysaccharide biosynthesis WecB/TagA/CpsF family protein